MANFMGGATIIVQLEVDQKKTTLKENKNYSTMKAFLNCGRILLINKRRIKPSFQVITGLFISGNNCVNVVVKFFWGTCFI